MNLKPLLDFIAKYESNGDYNIVWGGIKPKDRPPKPLTSMTVREVLNWQDSIDLLYMSEAAGRYQILEDTLRDLVDQGKVQPTAVFDEKTQDQLAIALLNRRGLQRWLANEITASKFANNIAREWASMPVVNGPKRGRSYYAGDGLNMAHASVADFLIAVIKTKEPPPTAQPEPKPTGGILAAFFNALIAFFGGKK